MFEVAAPSHNKHESKELTVNCWNDAIARWRSAVVRVPAASVAGAGAAGTGVAEAAAGVAWAGAPAGVAAGADDAGVVVEATTTVKNDDNTQVHQYQVRRGRQQTQSSSRHS